MAASTVTICVATFRRPRGLARLLQSLARQKRPDGVEIEIVVVDNDPDGGAEATARAAGCADGVRWLAEPEPNIALARNRAVQEARGSWLAFVDDDEEAEESWLSGLWETAQREQADGVFGPVLPEIERVVTPWLDTESCFGRPRIATGTSVGLSMVRTGNALVRAAAIREQGFDPGFGRTGGSDTELFRRLLKGGARFLWCDEAVVRESIPAARHTPGWLLQRAFRGGFVSARIEELHDGSDHTRIARACAAFTAFTVALPFAALRGPMPALQVARRLAVQAGRLWAEMGGSHEEYGANLVGSGRREG